MSGRLPRALVAAAALLILLLLATESTAFSGKNGKLVYAAGLRSAAGGIPLDLYLLPATGGKAALLVRGGSGGSWSPDGRSLAYMAGEYSSEIYVLDTATGTTTQVTRNALNDGAPAWSPDGKRIAFVGEDSPQIVSVATNGSGARRLSSGAIWAVNPEWSPDGKQIAFTNLAPHGIFAVASGGGSERRLTPGGSKLFYYDLSWQPVGAATADAGNTASAGDANGPVTRRACTIDGAHAGHWRILLLPGTKKEIRHWQTDGSDGNDVICGTPRDEMILPGKGDDIVYAGPGDDLVQQSAGNDTLYGEAGSDSLYDGEGADLIVGGTGKDLINAADAQGSPLAPDTVLAGPGDDEIATHAGARDVVDGGAGADNAYTDAGLDAVTNVEQAVGPGGQPIG